MTDTPGELDRLRAQQMTFAEKQGEHNARLGSLEDSRLQLHDDLREIRDLIRQGQQPRPAQQESLATHNLADALRAQTQAMTQAVQQMQAIASKPHPGLEIAQAIASNKQSAPTIIYALALIGALALGGLVMFLFGVGQ